jgi:hypothetical protein
MQIGMAKATRTSTTKRTSSNDPIFALIRDHKRLDREWLALSGKGEQRDVVDRASDAADKAAWAMARTQPTTIAGASAWLAYVTTGPITGLLTLGPCDWHPVAFKSVSAVLGAIARAT